MYLSHIPEPIETVSSELEDQLSTARAFLVVASGLLAYQLYKCRIYFTRDENIKTAAACITETENLIMINDVFFSKLPNDKQRAFVLLHEMLHIFLLHGPRQKAVGYDGERWNRATDYNINLTASGIYIDATGRKAFNTKYTNKIEVPEWVLYDEDFINMSADEIYYLLDEDPKSDKSKGGNGQPGSGEAMDDVVYRVGDTAKQETKNIQSSIAAVSYAEDSGGIGENELGLAQMYQKMAEPKIPWEDKIDSSVLSAVEDHETYSIYNNRSNEIIFPTLYSEKIRIVFGIDTSGSMGERDSMRALGELKGVLEQFDAWEITVISADTEAYLIGTFDNEDDEDFLEGGINLSGGGGTRMSPIYQEAVEIFEEEEFDACIIVTDGHLAREDLKEVDSRFKTIVLVTEEGNKELKLNEHVDLIFID